MRHRSLLLDSFAALDKHISGYLPSLVTFVARISFSKRYTGVFS